MTAEEAIRRPVIANATQIYDLLARLGVTANYVGFRQGAYAVHLATENPDRLIFVSKWLYPEVARRYHTTWGAVERNIRTISGLAWESNPALLRELAGRELQTRPKAAQFIAILALCILRDQHSE